METALGVIFILVIVAIAAPQIYTYAMYIIVFAGFGLVVWSIHKYFDDQRKAEIERIENEKANREKIESEIEDDHRRIESNLTYTVRETISEFKRSIDCLLQAEHELSNARMDFAETAFSPFWESIDAASKGVFGYKSAIKNMVKLQESYWNYVVEATEFQDSQGRRVCIEKYPISFGDLVSVDKSEPTVSELNQLIRLAQRDHDFADIYEQRRTNMILLEGFQTLRDAIESLSSQISSSMVELGDQLNDMSTKISDVNYNISILAGETREFSDSIVGTIEKTTIDEPRSVVDYDSHLKTALTRLDNIQRNREPAPWE